MPFWRAEVVRMALHCGGIPFEDVRDWGVGKPLAPFGALPVMEVDGKILSQTQAMATYAGKLAGLYPEDSWLAAKCDEAINGCTDVTGTVGATMRIQDEGEKLAARSALIASDGRLTLHLGGIEKLLVANGSNGCTVGDALTVADLAIWRLAGWLGGGAVDGIPKDYPTDTFPALAALVAKVDAHEGVVSWKAMHPDFYA